MGWGSGFPEGENVIVHRDGVTGTGTVVGGEPLEQARG